MNIKPSISDRIASGRISASFLRAPIAHRGLFDLEHPENSLGAFQLAIEHGLPIECDVHLLADGRLVVFHDKNLLRMTGRDYPIRLLTATEVKHTHLLNSAHGVPLLEDVLELVHGAVPLLIELKSFSLWCGALEVAVISALRHYRGEFSLQSFNFGSLLWLKKNAPHVTRGQLSTGHMAVPFHRFTMPDFVAYNIDMLPRAITTRLRSRGIPLLAWTVTSRREQVKAMQEADNYIFNQSPEIMPFVQQKLREFRLRERSNRPG